jgi:uracil-DNA glycosylase
MSNFDPGYYQEPFLTLCNEYPQSNSYNPSQFRVEWGPIFHRGRLDGSARILIIGQDPAQHETIIRRILVGEAGRRTQGFLGKLGITHSYVMINCFLYSAYGSPKAKTRRDPQLVDYRNRWLDALLLGKNVEAVVALGSYANEAWQMWKTTPNGNAFQVSYSAITHPTYPESYSKGNHEKLVEATKKMLSNWNIALQLLKTVIIHPDEQTPLILYGDSFSENDKSEIPEKDFPPGLPDWMRQNDGWANRVGKTPKEKRANITLTVPPQNLPT